MMIPNIWENEKCSKPPTSNKTANGTSAVAWFGAHPLCAAGLGLAATLAALSGGEAQILRVSDALCAQRDLGGLGVIPMGK